jgi:hypothetical protein
MSFASRSSSIVRLGGCGGGCERDGRPISKRVNPRMCIVIVGVRQSDDYWGNTTMNNVRRRENIDWRDTRFQSHIDTNGCRTYNRATCHVTFDSVSFIRRKRCVMVALCDLESVVLLWNRIADAPQPKAEQSTVSREVACEDMNQ